MKFPNFYPKTAGLLFVACTALALQGADLQYTFTGSEFNGILNGVPFSKATLTITGIADPVGVIFTPVMSTPSYVLPLTPSIVIDDGVTSYSATLINAGGLEWGLISQDFGGGFQTVAFGHFDDFLNATVAEGIGLVAPGSGYDFSTPILLTPFFVGGAQSTYSTSVGDLVLGNTEPVSGSFSATAVPEVSTFMPVGFALVGGGILVARRRRTQAQGVV